MNSKLIHRILIILALLTAFAMANASSTASAKGISDDIASAVDGMFTDGDSGVRSFTDFEGGIQAPTADVYDPSLTQVKDAREFVVKVVQYALGFLGLFAVVMIIYGGFLYVSSGGESEGPEKGKKVILYAVIGLLIIMGSYTIVNTVIKAPGGSQAALSQGSSGGKFASAAQYGKNIQATRAFNLSTFVMNAYRSYALALPVLRGLETNIENIWTETFFKDGGDATNATNSIETNYSEVASALQTITSQSIELTALSDMVEYQKLYVNSWLIDRRDEIAKLKNTPVNTGTIKSDNPKNKTGIDFDNLAKDEEWIVSQDGKNLAQNCYEDSPLSTPSAEVCIRGRFKQYQKHFNTEYKTFIDRLKSSTTSYEGGEVGTGLKEIQAQIDDDFKRYMESAIKELADIESSSKAWPEQVKAQFLKLQGGGSGTQASGQNVFSKLLANKKNPVESKNNLKDAAVGLGDLYELLKNIEGVAVKLSANITQGNAPLIVTFNTVGSGDPSNKSILDTQISWDLDGDGNYEKNSIDCPEKHVAVITCIYKKPGTYRVGVKVASSSPNIVEGVEYIDVKVSPPRARFSIQLIMPNAKPIVITDYDKDGLIKIDTGKIQLAYSNASQGITFSAVGTTSGDVIDRSDKSIDFEKKTQDTIQRMKWDFGDGTTAEDSPLDNAGIMKFSQTYKQRGTYQVTLEVTGKDGVIDRKIFFVTIADISAIIYVIPGYVNKVNTPVTFQSAVTSDNSKVTNYEWSSSPEKKELMSDKASFSTAINKPGNYMVTLKVRNEKGNEGEHTANVIIESNTPQAKFVVKQPKIAQPSEIELNASETYDPDGPNPDIIYRWIIGGELGKDYIYTQGNEDSKIVRLKFLATGERTIELKVEDKNEKGKSTKATNSVNITTLLGAEWTAGTQRTGVLDDSGKALIAMGFATANAATYSLDFGDGEVEDGVFAEKQGISTKHAYGKTGVFTMVATIEDEAGTKVKLTKKIVIGGGKNPIASANILVNGEEVEGSDSIMVNRKDVITFDASGSKNVDGSVKNLDYAWDFGDGKKSTKSLVKYSYKDISPVTPGYYTVTLRVTDKDEPTKTAQDVFKIKVLKLKPSLKTITIVPLSADNKTPMKITLKAVDARAPEGQIATYRWWYYDTKDTENQLGSQITTVPETTMTIGTKGGEGEEVTYAFNIELRDTENQTITASEILGEEKLPTHTVINGANKPPKASFKASKTTVETGETVTFTSTSTDADGKIVSYVWDLDGDGFQNDEVSQKTSVTKFYATPSTTGVKVRLKVVDDSFTEASSEPVPVIVKSKYAAPKASFSYQQKAGTLQMNFQNTSSIDPALTLKSSTWDFDTASGNKDTDKDSLEKNPVHLFKSPGAFYVKLTIEDSSGAIASATLPVNVKTATQQTTSGVPTFAAPGTTTTQTSSILEAKMNTIPAVDPLDGRIHLTGNAGNITIDFSPSQGKITKYVIDKNTYFDSNNDGIKDNDENFTSLTPTQWTTDFQKVWGKTGIKLTVIDATGKTHSITKEVIFDAPLASGANNIFIIPGAYELYGGIASMFGFGILTYRNRQRKKKTQA